MDDVANGDPADKGTFSSTSSISSPEPYCKEVQSIFTYKELHIYILSMVKILESAYERGLQMRRMEELSDVEPEGSQEM